MTKQSANSNEFIKGIQISLFILLLITVIGWLLWDVDIQGFSLAQLWAQTDNQLFFIALLLISCAMPCIAMRWRALFPKQHRQSAHPVYLTGVLCAAFVFNFALPGPVGEALSAWMAKEKSDVNFSEALAGLGMSRIIGLGSACSIAGTVYWLAPFQIPEQWGTALQITATVLFLVTLSLAFAVIFPGVPKKWLLRISRYPLFQRAWIKPIFDAADHLFQALIETAGRGKGAYIESAMWAVLGHVLVASGIYLSILSMGLSAELSAVMFTYTASIAGSVAMFMLPGSSVGWDALFGTTLSVTANLPIAVAAAVTAIIRIQQMLVALIGVIVVWLYAKELLLRFLDENKNQLNNSQK